MVACFAGERYYGKCFYIICCLKSFTPRNKMYFSFITVADFQSSEKIINNEKFRHGIFFLRLNTGKLIAVIPYFHRPKFYDLNLYQIWS